jgi:hypothetical protein
MHFKNLSLPLWPAVLAIAFSTIGWLGMPDRRVIFADAIPGIKELEVMFALPGGLLAALVSMIFSPQGGHGLDQFAWLIFPINLVIYFGLFNYLLTKRRKRQGEMPERNPL